MATYEFECLTCNNIQQYNMPMKDASGRMTLFCTECRKSTLQKQKVTASPVHFKGGGWPDKGG